MTTLSHRLRMETLFVELMTGLFQLDEAEALDFGLYRVIRHHNREVKAFLGEIVATSKDTRALQGGKLSEMLNDVFKKADHEAHAADKARIKEIEAQLGLKAGMTQAQREDIRAQAASIPAAKALADEYKALQETLTSSDTSDHDRTEVLNRLYQFFSRNYQDGDFIVERRYGKGGARYVRSTGEDTEFHWATEGMYYIKSGDIFTDYPVRLANGQRIVFTVDTDSLQTTRAALKPNDKAHYEFAVAEKDGDRLVVRLKYLKGAQTEKQREDIVAGIHAQVGGDPADIKRWLNRHITRNQSDFFIHKRLKEALSEDLDIFIKTEVLDADQLLADKNLSASVIKVGRVMREIGLQIIDFLAVLEDFQKALWEKKKLVFETSYVITLDRLQGYVPDWLEQHIAQIVAVQQQEWEALGLGAYASAASCRKEFPGDLATPARQHYLPLPVDSCNFDQNFKWSLLGALTATVSLDEVLDGVAIQSDNWQALNTLESRLKDRAKCIYIDPPYNTNAGGIPYKNGYRHASWIALMENRVEKLHRLLSDDGAIFVSIDKVERTALEQLLDRVFGSNNRIEELIWIQNTNDGKSPTYSTNHEYIEVYAKQRQAVEQDRAMFREPKPGYAEVMELVEQLNPDYPSIAEIEAALKALYAQHKAEYRDEIEALGLDWGVEKRNDPWKGLFNYSCAEYRDSQGQYVEESAAKERGAEIWIWREDNWTIMSSETKQSDTTRNPKHPNYRLYQPIHPITGKPCTRSTRGWKGTQFIDPEYPERNSLESLVNDHRIAFGPDEKKVPQQKRMLHEVETNVAKSVFNDYSDGEKQTMAMFGKAGLFLAPKHTNFVSRFILQATTPASTVVDCFGGSGSTAHAVIELNRTEKSRRKFVTVEVNRYFDTLIVPRLIKAGCSGRWSNGKAKELNGAGLFMRIQRLEQYDDTLENLDIQPSEGDSGTLFDNQAFALSYRIDQTARALYCGVEHFTSPFGYQLKRVEGGGDAPPREVDLVESLAYLMGLDIARLYRDPEGVVMTGTNRRGQPVAVFFRDCAVERSSQWVEGKLADHPADRVFTNAPASLSFPGCERLESIESIFALQFGRA
jgi:adenine-specific DNA-methyltransferase